ncbi:hypothetical protein ELD05_04500 [Caldicellulosiruptor changbaiensis]|uniref:Uncharacterized protein n=2 Tax=Caldicellulosiruptor TaxID=44000 RepID=A4XJJ3_CALS8|nr:MULTISPECIES: ABC transporter permease [Caldicellulosiruptor]ABP67078.1 hypothetical protein Csac_1478 [Caldicellulosiruptor saccharolyticus DSM 8903]AZT89969.1 hypothetical protein ELD05_04500 [Caldicellulosiruptor changbaiensis]
MFFKIIKLEVKNYIKNAIILLLILNIAVWYALKNFEQFLNYLKDKPSISLFYTLCVVITISYSIVFITTINFDKDKSSYVYHRYFTSPLSNTLIFLSKVIPVLITSSIIVFIWVTFILLKSHLNNIYLFLFVILTVFVFSLGCIFIIYSVSLTTKNSVLISGVKFSLVFLFSYIPKLAFSSNISIQVLKAGLILLCWGVFIVGLVILKRINVEKIITS